MKKLITLTFLIIFSVAAIAVFFQIPTQEVSNTTFTTGASIFDYASSYSGILSRPLFPDHSLFLPLLLQVFISCGLILTVAAIALFFPAARKLMMIVTMITVARHLLWRGFETLDFTAPASIAISLLIYSAELLSFFAMVIGYFQVWEQKEEVSVSLEGFPQEHLPSVDIMVCTYSEPVSVLYRSLVGCLSIEYARKTVYLCDDGNRTEMRDLANRLGVTYISRARNDHAKAGNLNNAMRNSHSDLVLVFDADHVPAKNFLKETVGFFTNERLGFVQTPQHFFTEDPFQRNLLAARQINNEQDLFFHVIQPGNNHWGSAFFAGSGALFRRVALESVGGFAVETITEDVHTGMRIHGKGWESLYYNKDLAAGMAQESFSDVIKQRLRWARGMTQIYILENPLFMRGLSLAQKLCYFTGIWYFFHGLPRLVFMIAPLFFLLFGLKTINSGFVEVLIYYLPSFLATTIGYTLVSRGVRHSFWSEVYEVAFSIYLVLTTSLTFLTPRQAKFRVTPKGGLTERANFNWRIVFPQVLIAALTLLGIGMAIVRAVYTPEYAGGIYTNLAWSLYNLVLLMGAIYVAQERPQFRLAPRIFRKVRCELKLLDGSMAVGHTTNISESGVAAVFDEPIPMSGVVLMKLMDFDVNETTVLSLQAIRSTIDAKGRHYIGFKIVNRTEEQHRQMVKHMFSSSETWLKDYVFTETSHSFFQLITTPFRVSSKEAKESAMRRSTLRFNAALSCALKVNNHVIEGTSSDISETGMSLIINGSLPVSEGAEALIGIQWPQGNISELPVKIIRLKTVERQQTQVGLSFYNLAAVQHMDLVKQIYRPKDRLVRVAPPVRKLSNCFIKSADGSPVIPGLTQEISELGVMVQLGQQSDLQPHQKVSLQIQWDPEKEPMSYPAEVIDTSNEHGVPVALLYFDGLDLKTLDQISERLHQPIESQTFQGLTPG
jgi:cellulose synthase (UDP-forming)